VGEEICEGFIKSRSTILTSQLPVAGWHEQIGDSRRPTAFWTAWFTIPISSRCAAIHA
jgi:hypothetical protein